MLIKAIVGDLMLYAIQFHVLPTLLPWFYPSGVIAYILFFGTAFIIFWIWTKYLHVRASEWAVSDIFYFLVVAAYGVQTTDGIYGVERLYSIHRTQSSILFYRWRLCGVSSWYS